MCMVKMMAIFCREGPHPDMGASRLIRPDRTLYRGQEADFADLFFAQNKEEQMQLTVPGGAFGSIFDWQLAARARPREQRGKNSREFFVNFAERMPFQRECTVRRCPVRGVFVFRWFDLRGMFANNRRSQAQNGPAERRGKVTTLRVVTREAREV